MKTNTRRHESSRLKTRLPFAFLPLLAAIGMGETVFAVHVPSALSKYKTIVDDVLVTTNDQTILSHTFTLDTAQDVLVEADGSYYPTQWKHGRAQMKIRIDGVDSGTPSAIDWRTNSSVNPVRHSFNCIRMASLAAGTHTIELKAHLPDQIGFYVGSDSCLGILVNPGRLSSVSGSATNINVQSDHISDYRKLPSVNIMTAGITANNEDVIILASGYGQKANNYVGRSGDMMWMIHLNHKFMGENYSLSPVNDCWEGAEQQAPMFTHARFPGKVIGASGTISLEASEFPWLTAPPCPQLLTYDVPGADLIVLGGGLGVCGSANNCIPGDKGRVFQEFQNIGGHVPRSPPLNEWRKICEGTMTIPEGHNGIVMVCAKARFQGDEKDEGGYGLLRIKIDGAWIGSGGIQELRKPAGVSQRTVCTSYLSSESGTRLSVGSHAVEAWGMANGTFKSFRHLSIHRETILVWFD